MAYANRRAKRGLGSIRRSDLPLVARSPIILMMIMALVVLLPGVSLATDVGGIIDTDATWDLAGSPYHFISDVQIAAGVTLTINPGVVVNGFYETDGAPFRFRLWGDLYAVGTETSNIIFNGVTVDDQNASSVTLQFVQIDGEYGTKNYSFTVKDGGVFVLRDSTIITTTRNVTFSLCDHSLVERNHFNNSGDENNIGLSCTTNTDDCYIEKNVFINSVVNVHTHVAGFNVYFRNNVLAGSSIISANLTNSASEATDPPIVEYNSFLNTANVVFWGGFERDQSAINNYWNTTDTSVIDQMIHDRNDDLGRDGYVAYIPFLTQSHPDTPTLSFIDPPTANAGPDQIVFNEVTLDGSQSNDPDGTITSWDWTFTHRTDASLNRTASGEKPTVSNLAAGFYDVTLVVTDNDGAVDTDTMLLGVAGTWDINDDDKLGLAEIIFILQTLSGVR